jgi:hypothetical protein
MYDRRVVSQQGLALEAVFPRLDERLARNVIDVELNV